MADEAKIIKIADALVAALNVATFVQSFEATRSYQPTFELPDMKTLRVSVVPKGKVSSPEGSNREARAHLYQIDIGIQKKLSEDTATEQAQFDAMMALVQEIDAHLEEKRLPGADDAKWMETINEPVFIPEHLEQYRQFSSVLTLTYRATRE